MDQSLTLLPLGGDLMPSIGRDGNGEGGACPLYHSKMLFVRAYPKS